MLSHFLKRSILFSTKKLRAMSNSLSSSIGTSHVERTAAEPRDESLHRVILGDVTLVNDCIRVLRLNIPRDGSPIKFLAGQWLDVHVPGIPKPGGFTITSAPLSAQLINRPPPHSVDGKGIPAGYLELAVQKSPSNPPAAWLWRPVPEILGRELHVRIGGSFVWPPPGVDLKEVERVVLVAGGVGINPFMSMIWQIGQVHRRRYAISVLYSARDPGDQGLASVLYLESLARLFKAEWVKGELVLHLTSGEKGTQSLDDSSVKVAGWKMRCRRRRITKDDLLAALGSVDERRSTLVYVCGVPVMTDELVEVVQLAPGMDPKKVLFERWW